MGWVKEPLRNVSDHVVVVVDFPDEPKSTSYVQVAVTVHTSASGLPPPEPDPPSLQTLPSKKGINITAKTNTITRVLGSNRLIRGIESPCVSTTL